MKFGGTSVATETGRASIARRVLESLEAGAAPVVVVSAMGRKGEPYATDTLLDLVDGLPADEHEHDLLMSTGEVISAVVVAHELRLAGVDARAFTGPEAGIATDGIHGNSSVTEIHPAAAAIGDRCGDRARRRRLPGNLRGRTAHDAGAGRVRHDRVRPGSRA